MTTLTGEFEVASRDENTFLELDGEKAAGTWSVLPGSSTGGLIGIRGEGRFEAPRGPKATYSLDVTLA